MLSDSIDIRFTPKTGRPLLSGIEIHRLDDAAVPLK
jgi:hypothetical protein